jgi:hypothetical protein
MAPRPPHASLAARSGERPNPAPEPLLDAQEVARRLGVSRWFVYDHWRELGGVRLGDTARAPLRFAPERVAEVRAAGLPSRMHPDPAEPAPERSAPPRRRRRSGTAPALLPIRGPEVPR